MRLSGEWLARPETRQALALLTSAGHLALLVGGCVRNAVLGEPVSDIDIATSALPQDVMHLAQAEGISAVPTGIDHGTVTLVIGGVPHEVTTFRRDVATDGRHAVVAFATNPAEDARRRDFTMNALYAQSDGTVLDPLGGLGDALARRVRFVGDAGARIREDHLRILRFFRFHARYGDPALGIDAEGLAACAGLADGVATLSRERVGAEMRKLLSVRDPAPALASMQAAGVLGHVLAGADAAAVAVLVHLEDGHPVDWLGRLAALGGTEDARAALRLSRDEAAGLAALSQAARSDDSPAALGWQLGARARAAHLVRGALGGAAPGAGDAAEIARGMTAVFPVQAADLMPGLQGPALGQRLKDLQQTWLRSGLSLSREALLNPGPASGA